MTGPFALSDDQVAIQEMARRFTAAAITPHAARWDEEHTFPRETIRAAAEPGFGGIYVSEASGGIGLGRLNIGARLLGGAQRFWRDLRVHRILEGTNEVMRMTVGRDLLR